MNSSINPIKALAHRFVSLPPLVRMQVTKRLLELYSSEQSHRGVDQSGGSHHPALGKSFLEQFWDVVEQAHGDYPDAVNPFTQASRAKTPKFRNASETDEQRGYLPWHMHQSSLIALL
jgi:hypothetical protein